jgi:predicted DNA-binding transcriptional regulator AlpA
MIEELITELTRVVRQGARWPAVMSREIAAEYCSLSASGFDQWVREGRLPPPISGTKRWSRAAIDHRVSLVDGTAGLTQSDDDVSVLDNWLRENGHE